MYEDNIKFHGFFSTQGYPNKVQRIIFFIYISSQKLISILCTFRHINTCVSFFWIFIRGKARLTSYNFIDLNNYHVPNTSELYKVVSDMFSLSKFKSNLLVTKSKQRTKAPG